MSKFVVKLHNLANSSNAPIGFRHSIPEAKSPTMLLVARLFGAKLSEAKIIADSNANAGLIWDEGLSNKIVGQMVKALRDIPLGVYVRGTGEQKMDELVSLGCDFVVLDISIPASVLQKEDVGKFLMMKPSLDQGLARAINSLAIDGVFISGESEDSIVAVEHLLVCRRFVEILEKPVIMVLPSFITKAELAALRETGVVGLVAGSRQSSETLRELGAMINELPEKPEGRRAKADVKLPQYGGSVSGEEDEEQEEI